MCFTVTDLLNWVRLSRFPPRVNSLLHPSDSVPKPFHYREVPIEPATLLSPDICTVVPSLLAEIVQSGGPLSVVPFFPCLLRRRLQFLVCVRPSVSRPTKRGHEISHVHCSWAFSFFRTNPRPQLLETLT